jgi:hypothetical protein
MHDPDDPQPADGTPGERICVTGNMIARDGRDLPEVVESVKRTNDGQEPLADGHKLPWNTA